MLVINDGEDGRGRMEVFDSWSQVFTLISTSLGPGTTILQRPLYRIVVPSSTPDVGLVLIVWVGSRSI